MTFGNNQNKLNSKDNLSKTQIINPNNNTLNMSLNNLSSSNILPLNKNYNKQKTNPLFNLKTDNLNDIEMFDETENNKNYNIQQNSNIEFDEDQSIGNTNINVLNLPEKKYKKKKKKLKKTINKKKKTQKYIQSIIEEECNNYESLQKEGIPAIIPYLNEEGKQILFSYKRKSGPNYDYRCKDRNCNGLAQLKKNGDFKLKKACSIIFEKHNYIIKNNAINKLKKKKFKKQI